MKKGDEKMKKIFTLILTMILLSSLVICAENSGKSKIEMGNYDSSIIGEKWKYRIYLPKSYYTDEKKTYPVLYLLHGHGGTSLDWQSKGKIKETLDELTENGKIPEIIAVMINGKNSWYVNGKVKMEDAIIKEMIPYIEKTYRIKSEKQYRAIGGLSAGGYGTLRFILKYPEMFSGGIILSPAAYEDVPPKSSSAMMVEPFTENDLFSRELWTKYNYPSLWSDFEAKKEKVKIYIASGDSDELGILDVSYKVLKKFQDSGYYPSFRVVGGGHSWDVWNYTVKDGIVIMFNDCF